MKNSIANSCGSAPGSQAQSSLHLATATQNQCLRIVRPQWGRSLVKLGRLDGVSTPAV